LAVYYFEYDGQIFSPIAQRVYELQAAVIVEHFDMKEEAPSRLGRCRRK
jgi:hypothetical protein